MNTQNTFIENLVYGFSIIIGAILLLLSGFFWNNGEYNLIGGTILIIANTFWIIGYAGIFGLIKQRYPVLSVVIFFMAVYGCMGGASFGFRGIYSSAFHLEKATLMSAWEKFPVVFNITSFWPGPLFPLALFILGILLIKIRILKLVPGLLFCIGALTFPVGRISRIEMISHLSDAMLLIPAIILGWHFVTNHSNNRLSGNPRKP